MSSRITSRARCLLGGALVACLLIPALLAGGAASATSTRDRSPRPTDGWWYQLMHIADAQRQVTGKGVTVAMIDATINLAPPELQGADISLRRDCYGHPVRQRPGSEQFHGTAMAGLIVGNGRGNGPGGGGVLGVAPDARLLFYGTDTAPSAAGKAPFTECTGWDDDSLVRAAVRAGADIITVSMGENAPVPPLRKAIAWAIRRGVVVVAASGDTGGAHADSSIEYPAGFPGVVAVNAVDRHARPWSGNPPPSHTDFRGWSFPVISAPGVHVNALGWFDGHWDSNGFVVGTSPATAIVAGCLALVKQKYPEATGRQLVQQLIHYTGGTRAYGWDPKYGFGIVSVTKMLQHDPTKWPDVNPLLRGPYAAVKDFPMSSYGTAPTAGGTTATTGQTQATGTTPSKGGQQPATHGSTSSGVPSWVWVLVAAVVLAGGGAAGATMRKQRRGRPGTDTGSV